jgi:hypothetical protein
MAEREVLVLNKLREHGGWVTGREAGSWFPNWVWQTGYSTMQKLVKRGLVQKRYTDEVNAWGRRVPEYKMVPELVVRLKRWVPDEDDDGERVTMPFGFGPSTT